MKGISPSFLLKNANLIPISSPKKMADLVKEEEQEQLAQTREQGKTSKTSDNSWVLKNPRI